MLFQFQVKLAIKLDSLPVIMDDSPPEDGDLTCPRFFSGE